MLTKCRRIKLFSDSLLAINETWVICFRLSQCVNVAFSKWNWQRVAVKCQKKKINMNRSRESRWMTRKEISIKWIYFVRWINQQKQNLCVNIQNESKWNRPAVNLLLSLKCEFTFNYTYIQTEKNKCCHWTWTWRIQEITHAIHTQTRTSHARAKWVRVRNGQIQRDRNDCHAVSISFHINFFLLLSFDEEKHLRSD